MTVVINGTTGITNPNSMTIGNGGGSVATNTAVGTSALAANTTGASGVAIGSGALQANTTASNNTAVGYQAGYYSTGNDIAVFGFKAGFNNTSGTVNTYIGSNAGYSATTGSYNTFVGSGSSWGAGAAVTTGSKNTIIGGYTGNNGGLDIRTASNYIVLSDGDGNPRGFFDNSGQFLVGTTSTISGPGAARITAKSESTGWFAAAFEGYYGVGINAPVAGDNSFLYFYYRSNGSPVGRVYTNGTTTTYGTTSDYRLKEAVAPMVGAIEKVMQLKPCTYVWKSTQEASCGFIAHELQEVIPEAVAGEKDDVFENGQIKPQMVDAGSSSLIATLTAAIQELNAKVEAQAAEIAALKGQA